MRNPKFSQNAPVILFVYNRLKHSMKTVGALKKNDLSSKSILYIFSDGQKKDENQENVEKVRGYLRTIDGFQDIIIIERDENNGLAQSIISGVSEIIDKHGKAIILEDDLLTSTNFLNFMNKALDFYVNKKSIWSIGGYNFPLEVFDYLEESVYLSFRSCSWGWATWKDRWIKTDWKLDNYKELLNNRSFCKKFNRAGSDMCAWLKKQKESNLDSWAVKWDVSHCLNDGYCLRPTKSLIKNIGFDGSGIHCGTTNKFDVDLASDFQFELPENIKINEKLNKKISKYIAGDPRAIRIIKAILRYPVKLWNQLL